MVKRDYILSNRNRYRQCSSSGASKDEYENLQIKRNRSTQWNLDKLKETEK